MRYERTPPNSADALCALARDTLVSRRGIVVATDFDATVSAEADDGISPFTTAFNEDAGRALAMLQAHSQAVGIISNRAAGQIAERCWRAGFYTTPVIVGTYGYELRLPDGSSRIDEQFAAERDLVTAALHAVRRGMLATYGLADTDYHAVETTIPTPHGPVFLEIKGMCHDYPEGLAQEYNFNAIAPPKRTEMVAGLEQHMRGSLVSYDADRVRALMSVWGIESLGAPDRPGRYSWALRPAHTRAKAHGLIRLLRAIHDTALYQRPIGLLVYAGDHPEQDGQVMWAGKVLERVSHGDMRFVGIWAGSGADPLNASDPSDLHVAGVTGVASVLTRLAETVAHWDQRDPSESA
ncbi:MAG TPA: hypothetical protein VF818_00025 [Ktedonobacterales bacterium]